MRNNALCRPVLVFTIGILFVLGCLAGCARQPGSPSGQEPEPNPTSAPITIKFRDADKAEYLEISRRMVERFNQRAAGKCTIELYGVGELVNEPELLEAVASGAVEMAIMPLAIFANVDKRFGLVELPLQFKSHEAAVEAGHQLTPLYNEILESKFNQKVLTFYVPCPLDVATAKKPVRRLEDWKGLLTQAVSPVIADTVKELGGSPVVITWHEGYSALQKGVIDATIQSTVFIVDYALSDVAKYLTVADLVLGYNPLTINLDVWNSLPEEIQTILLEEAQQLGQEKREAFRRGVEDNLKRLSEQGMEIIRLDSAERERWVEKTQSYRDQVLMEAGDFGTRFRAVVEEANRKVGP